MPLGTLLPLVNGGRFEFFAGAVSNEDIKLSIIIRSLHYGGAI